MILTKKSRKIELLVAQGLNDFRSGSHRSLLRGWGGDLDSVRLWQPEDRRIAMAATARTGEIMTKVFEEPKLLTVWLLIDVSHSMYFGSTICRGEAAAVISRIIGLSADNSGDLTGAILFKDQVGQFYEPQQGDGLTRKIVDLIIEAEPDAVETKLAAALNRLARENPANSLAIIISDFDFQLDDDCVNLLRQINSGHNNSSLCLILYDEEEMDFARQCFVADIADAEQDRALVWDMKSRRLTNDWRAAFGQWREQIKKELRRAGSEVLFLNISSNFARDLGKFFSRKSACAI